MNNKEVDETELKTCDCCEERFNWGDLKFIILKEGQQIDVCNACIMIP